MKVLVYYQKSNKRSAAVTQALNNGIARAQTGENVVMIDESTYVSPLPNVKAVCFYGLSGNFFRLFHDYMAVGVQTIFFDLGYWGRKGEPQPDFHRVAFNGYMPTDYFWLDATPERFLQFHRIIKPWKRGGTKILAVGMSERAAKVWGFGSAKEHADNLIATIRQHTDRPIVYTAKTIHADPTVIPGVEYYTGPIRDILSANIHAVITYRSNVAIDGLIEGIPCFVIGDHPAKLMSHNDLTRIEDPLYLPDPERLRFCSSAAWHQYSLREIRSGFFWKQAYKHGWLNS